MGLLHTRVGVAMADTVSLESCSDSSDQSSVGFPELYDLQTKEKDEK